MNDRKDLGPGPDPGPTGSRGRPAQVPAQGGSKDEPPPSWSGRPLEPTPAGRAWRDPRALASYLRRHWLLALLAVLIVLVLAIRFLRRTGGEEEESAPAVVTAQTAVARVGDFAITVDALGTVQPRPGALAQVAAPAATRVARIMVATGDRVRAGQPLVQLDESVWVLQTEQARVSLDASRKAFERAERLFREGIAPRKDMEAAAADYAKARAELEAARRTQALGTLRSPIDGVVTALRASLAQAVDVNQPLVEVVNPAGLEVLFHLSPTDASRLAPGAEVELTAVGEGGGGGTAAGALGGPAPIAGSSAGPAASPAAPVPPASQFLGRGTITGISAAVDSTGAVTVRATVTSPAVTLRAGQSVAGHLVVGRRRAVIVPVSALVPSGDSVQVFVVDARAVAHVTPVRVGERDEREAEIVAGLRGGETVVTGGAYGVTDSARIRPLPAAGTRELAPGAGGSAGGGS